jgi:DNA-binding NarL/FixJ family response regulator
VNVASVTLQRGNFCILSARSTVVDATGRRQDTQAEAGLELNDGALPVVRVLVADDTTAARAGIKRAIEPHGLQVVGEASNADDAVRLALALEPDVCVIAVDLPGSGVEVTRAINQALPDTKIVMMSATARDEDLLEALRAGADGYLLMSTPANRLPHAIRGVTQGEAALPRAMTRRLILELRERGMRRRVLIHPDQAEVELTAREFEVFQRLRRHEGTAQIASRLGISQVTVRRHVASVLHKLGAPNRRRAIEMLEHSDAERPALADGVPPATGSPAGGVSRAPAGR